MSGATTSLDERVGRLRSAASSFCSAPPIPPPLPRARSPRPITGPWGTFTVGSRLSCRRVSMRARSSSSSCRWWCCNRWSPSCSSSGNGAWSITTCPRPVTREIATLIDVYKSYPQGADRAQLRRIAQDRLGLVVDFLPGTQLPPPGPKPFFLQLDATLSDDIRKQIGLPFWIDTVGRSSIVEIRIKLDDTIMRVFARRADAYDLNAWIFLVWMVVTSLVVLTIAILFLRNQIRPIVRAGRCRRGFRQGQGSRRISARAAREKCGAPRPPSWK